MLSSVSTPRLISRPGRFSFAVKLVIALTLVALADLLLLHHAPGAVAGLFGLACMAGVMAARPGLWRDRPASAALAVAAGLCLVLVDNPGPLALLLGWAALSLAVLLGRGARFDTAWRWLWRLVAHPFSGLFRLAADAKLLAKLARRRPPPFGRLVPLLALPVIGSLVFLALFASANPVIRDLLARIHPGALFEGLTPARAAAWITVGVILWGLLRPGLLLRFRPVPAENPAWQRVALPLPGLSVASVTLSLVAFNALFAVQNALDVVFLWSGAPLPGNLTLATYAHRGAYPLIATALLAALFVLVALRPGTPMAASAAVRRLVFLWIAQNVVLVIFSIERTLNYVDAFSLTRLRLAALIWMGLVAVGLILICWRVFRRKSAAWLINANAAAALAVMAGAMVADLGNVVAGFNASHNRELTGDGAALDLCYMRALGPAALVPLTELEARDISEPMRAQVRETRLFIMDDLGRAQADWRTWTLRNARRIEAARRLTTDWPADYKPTSLSGEFSGLCSCSSSL